MVFGECLYIVVGQWVTVDERLHVGEEVFLLIYHVVADGVRIIVVKLHYELCQAVVLVKSLRQLVAYERQLEAKVVFVACLEIFQQCRHRQFLHLIVRAIAVDGKVDHGQERLAVHSLFLAHLPNGLVSKAEADTEGAKTLKYIVVVTDNRNEAVIGLIHLLILHNDV